MQEGKDFCGRRQESVSGKCDGPSILSSSTPQPWRERSESWVMVRRCLDRVQKSVHHVLSVSIALAVSEHAIEGVKGDFRSQEVFDALRHGRELKYSICIVRS